MKIGKNWLLACCLGMICIAAIIVEYRMTNLFSRDLSCLQQDLLSKNSVIEQRIQSLEENDNIIIDQITTLVGVTHKAVTDLLDFTTQQHNTTLQLVRANQEAINVVNMKIPDPNLLPKLVKQLTPSVGKIKVHLGFDEWTGEEEGWSGSGVFVMENLILTAGHVVDGIVIEQNADPEYLYKVGAPIEVELVDGTKLKVVDVYLEDVGITDLGIIKIEFPEVSIPEKLLIKPMPLSFGTAEVGEQVFSIGEPFGFFPTVTCGIVSALDVDVEDDFWGEANLLQTDCPINPGNSGGPLFNMRGEIIGITVGIYCSPVGRDGIGFCVPSSVCKLVIEKYLATKALEAIE